MAHHRNLTEEQKKFIEDNMSSMSSKQISKKLGLSKKAVQNHKNSIHDMPLPKKNTPTLSGNPHFPGKLAKLVPALLFLSILIFAFTLRNHTFNLPHYRGDQHHYIGLAMKLDKEGMDGYTLRQIDMYGSRKYPNLVTFALAKDKGQVIKGLEQGGITYYDEPLHHMPFGFPAALMISHKIFASGEPYYALAIPNDSQIIRQAPGRTGLKYFRFPADVTGKQFYAVIVPLFFSFMLIICTYFLAKLLYNNETIALTAMFLMTISPIDILTSQKVWADDMTAGLTALSAVLYMLSKRKGSPLYALAGGLTCGIAIITKQMAAILPISLIAWHFISNIDRLFRKETCLKVIFDRDLILFGAGAAAASAYWFIKINSTYGNPLYRPHQQDLLEKSATGWFQMMKNRPKHLYLLGIPYQNPLFALAYISPIALFFDRRHWKERSFAPLWLIITFIMAYNFFTGEHRYMLPFYASFALSGAYVADKIRILLNRQLGYQSGTLLLITALIASAIWSIPMALETLYFNGAVIMKPF